MLKGLVCALLCLLFTGLIAEDVDWAAIGEEVKELHTDSRKEGDLWTAIQLEAFVKRYPETKIRLSSFLGRSTLVGSPLFAFPENVRNHWDLGADVWAVTNRRFYALKENGRPSQLSFEIPIHPGRSTLNSTRQFVALANTVGNFRARILQTAVMDIETGDLKWRKDTPLTGIPEGQQDHLHHSMVVAHDGSALVTALYRQHGDFVRLQVVTPNSSKPLRGLSRPAGIGPGASWLIASRDRQRLLLSGGKETASQKAAIGPGVAVVRHGDKLSWVDSAGKLSPFVGNVTLGNRPDAWSHGEWLVVGTGEGAQTEPVTDLLGNVVEGSENQPYSLAFFRWSDLLENTKANPVTVLPGRYSRCDFKPNTLYSWTDTVISLIDLNGDEPVVNDWTEIEERVNRVDNSHHYTRVRSEGGFISFLNNAGEEMWKGQGFADAWVHSRGNGVAQRDSEEGPSFTHITLNTDKAQRQNVDLEIPKGWWEIRTNIFEQQVVANSKAAWHRVDMKTGKITQTVVKDPLVEFARAPWWRGEENQRGRFWRRDGRLLSKLDYGDDQALEERVVANDALYVGRSLLVVDKGRKVLNFESRKGFENLGDIQADVFTTDEDNETLLLSRGWNNRVVGKLERGPKISNKLEGVPENGTGLSSGPWKFDRQNRFMPPRGSQQQWDVERAGFSPRRLRSGGKRMIVVTSSIILVVEPRALSLISSNVP